MKTFKFSLVWLSLVLILFVNSNAGTAGEVTTEINLSGNMICKMSSSIIKKALQKVIGVKRIEIDINNNTVTVDYDDSKTSLESLEKALTRVGINANDKEADLAGYGSLPNCCKAK